MSLIKIASRPSPLALAQVQEVVNKVRHSGISLDYEPLTFQTHGDKDKGMSLNGVVPDDFFTDTIDQALLKHQADVAVHSAKDLPEALASGLAILALTECLDDKDAWVGKDHWQDLPFGAGVGSSSLLRKNQLLKLRPDLRMIDIRGTIEERLHLVETGQVHGVIVAACALKRLGLSGHIKDIFPWEGMPLQGQLAVVGRAEDGHLRNIFSGIDVRRRYGKVTLVGAGPGDPDLITIKGSKALAAADYIFYDFLADASLLKYAPQAKPIYVGKRKGEHSLPQPELSRQLKEKAFEGRKIVRLKGGDPLVFGRGWDEISYLQAYHIEVDVVPGVSSGTGIPSSLGIPLTARGASSSVAFVSGHEEGEDKDHPRPIAVPKADTVVFLMGLTKLDMIVQSLQQAEWPKQTPMMIVSNGTRPEERIIHGNLQTIQNVAARAGLKPPALVMAGKTIAFYRPRVEKVFLHCGTHPELYNRLGRIVPWPMIEIKPVKLSEAQEREFLRGLDDADLVLFTSSNSVSHFFKILFSLRPSANLGAKQFAAIGQHTQEALHGFKVKPAVVALEENARGLERVLTGRMDMHGKNILFPRSSLPNPFLKKALEVKGAIVHEVTVYENVKPARRPLPEVGLDGVIFTSPSTIRNFLLDYGKIPASWRIMAKGPVTLQALKEAGYAYAAPLS